MESIRVLEINRGSLLVSLGLLAFLSACGSDKTTDQTSTSSDESTSSGASTSTSHSSGHTSSTLTQGSDETSSTQTASSQTNSTQTTSNQTTSIQTDPTSSSQTRSDSTSTTSSSATGDEESSSATTQSDSSSEQESSTGQQLSAYERLCSSCHGPTGDGVDELGPDIKHPVEDYSEWVIRNGRTGTTMLAFDTEALSDDELSEIMEFLANQEQPTTGEGLYLDYCAACHGNDGLGGPTMRPIVNEAHEAAELVRNGHGGSAFDNRREYMPKWSEAELSEPELDLIITYIEGL